MMPITPMDWSLVAMRAGSQMLSAQMRLARVLYEAGLEQQKQLWGSYPPMAGTVGICGPVSFAGSKPAPTPRTARRGGTPRKKTAAAKPKLVATSSDTPTAPKPRRRSPARAAAAPKVVGSGDKPESTS